MYVVVTPDDVGKGVVVQEFTEEALPVALTVNVTAPVGATDPVAPVATAVNTSVEFSAPVPLPVSTKVFREAGAMTTGAAAVLGSAV